MYEPLKITAYPRCGIITDEYLPIDGILFYAAMRQAYGAQVLTTPGKVPAVIAVDLPLEKRIINGEWLYAASFAQWEKPADGQGFWVKRFDRKQSGFIDFGKRRGKVIVEQGRYKAYRMPAFYRHALSVSWYVVGDKAEIENLLAHVTHIGKKTAQGNGRIITWQVESWPHDWSITRDGELMRAVPNEAGILYGVRPSYWLSENQVLCKLP